MNHGRQECFMPRRNLSLDPHTRRARVGPTARRRSGRVRIDEISGAGRRCLVLNVFTPALSGGKRPVMVWLHGGGFSTGSGSQPILDGTSLAHTHDVVVVTINHRLNTFGFTYLGEAMGSDLSLSGGVGMLDIVAALQWVRDNIDRFGGDPNLVTILDSRVADERSQP